jgi:Ca2+-binding EF-hand superfamily protein
MQRFQTVTAVLGSVLFAGVISAQSTPTFESLDKNADGQISIQEATGHDDLFVAFKKLDMNKDGLLSKAEFAVFSKK